MEELNVKSVERLTDTDQLITYKIKPNLRTLGQKYGKGLAEIRNLLEKEDSSMLVSQLQSSGVFELNGGEYMLSRDDIFIETEPTDGFSAVSGDGITVGLSLDLDEDLLMEGLVRDIVRLVQEMRKNAGFAVEDRIEISWDFDMHILEALSKFDEYFRTETLTNNINKNIDNFDFEEVVEIDKRITK